MSIELHPRKLSGFDLNSVDRSLSRGPVNVEMPKFKASGKAQLSEVFRQLGVRTLFDSGTQFNRKYQGLSVVWKCHF